MNFRQIFFTILLIGVITYFIIKFIPTLERLADEGLSIVGALLLILGIGYLVSRVLRA
jgi:hypothetical protein